MSLPAHVADYYFANIRLLPPNRRFHFASRVWAWNKDERAKPILETCRSVLAPDPATAETLANMFHALLHTPLNNDADIPAYTQREAYFVRYQPLYGLELALFRLRHLEAVYGIGCRDAFTSAISTQELFDLEARLLSDRDALKVLSTYAINFLYLLHRVLLKSDEGIDVQALYNLKSNYDPSDKEALRLLVYLYTHCIVGETNFYVRPIPDSLMSDYTQMLKVLETLITEHYTNLSLDAKLEFLVCCRICNYETPLAARIHTECEHSLSPKGTFIIDTHNAFARVASKKTFEGSEHRNVLFIMSCSPYRLASADNSAANRVKP
ncbi:MAG TPA: hypothetical protein VJ836_02575 [Candidatus Saccharimonadales bacterium]|nr:hypothetical protein [Candidatus Saccharimonadales bacterium]